MNHRPIFPGVRNEDARRLLSVHDVTARTPRVGLRLLLFVNGQTRYQVWDIESGRVLQTLEGHANSVAAVAVMPDGRRAVSGSLDRTLKVWNLETGHALQTLKGHAEPVYAVAVTPDGRRAISGSWDTTLKVWDLENGRALQTLEGHAGGVRAVAVTPDSRRAVSASLDTTLRVWDLVSGAALATFSCDASATCCALAQDGTLVAGDEAGRVHVLTFEQ
jgi:WD40 repeat protein